MARGTSGSPGLFVTLLTAAALATVGFFAYQASAAPDPPAAEGPAEEQEPRDDGAPPDTPPGEDPAGPDGEEPGDEAEDSEVPVPAGSGTGKRVVYALEDQRVWLVDVTDDGAEEVLRTYQVHPSAVSPQPGEYAVTSRSAQVTGSDGVPVQHVVRFTTVGEAVIGFSTALDGSVPDPDADDATGGVRQSKEDGDAMWPFATVGLTVVVVP